MKPIQDEDELERALSTHPLKHPKEGLRERVLAASRTAWTESVPTGRRGRFDISWAMNGWLAIAAGLLFILTIRIDSYNRNAFHAQSAVDSPRDAFSHIAAVKAFADALLQQKQVPVDSEFIYR